jgi:hypothetical protein
MLRVIDLGLCGKEIQLMRFYYETSRMIVYIYQTCQQNLQGTGIKTRIVPLKINEKFEH